MKPNDSRITNIQVLYFARLREAFGRECEQLALPETVNDVAGLTAWLRQRGEVWKRELAAGRPVLIAINEAMASSDAPIKNGDKVAFMPPVTGG